MPYRMFVDPKRVNQLYRKLLDERDGPVTMQEVADALAHEGVINPRTRRGPSRQTVWQVLHHSDNAEGRQLVQESNARSTRAGQLARA